MVICYFYKMYSLEMNGNLKVTLIVIVYLDDNMLDILIGSEKSVSITYQSYHEKAKMI